MVSIKYLLEVGEFSCLKSMFADRVISVNCTSGPAVAAITQKESPKDTIQIRACKYLRMVGLSKSPTGYQFLCSLANNKVDGRAVNPINADSHSSLGRPKPG